MITALFLALVAPTAPSTSCAITAEQKAANARLSFDDFDQKGVTPETARKLAEAGCWAESAEATQHYLLYGPPVTDGQQRVLRFHLAQQLANAGREKEAAVVMAGARKSDEQLTGPEVLRWNDFVRGHWAFFTKDKAMLEASVTSLNSGTGFGNRLNGALLQGLLKCFDRSYRAAVDAPCRTPPAEEPK
jgi:hypothetical protein